MTTPTLRFGYSTGACAAAVISAAWVSLQQSKSPHHEELDQQTTQNSLIFSLLFPDGEYRSLSLEEVRPGYACLKKDGGDDPDCTHGSYLYAHIEPTTLNEATEKDYILSLERAHVILRAVEGIGLCTRPGLDCTQGKWAINPTPRRMIEKNLLALGLNEGCYIVRLGVKNGATIALKTLNARLGVMGGISILGTSGIVRPFSHAAYIATIQVSVRSLVLQKLSNTIVLCTGGRTEKTARNRLPHIHDSAFICIADFIGDSLRIAHNHDIQDVVIACMPGKLAKYAVGMENTHAHRNDQNIPFLLNTLHTLHTLSPEILRELESCTSMRALLDYLTPAQQDSFLRTLSQLALEQFRLFSDKLRVTLFLCDFSGQFLFSAPSSLCA